MSRAGTNANDRLLPSRRVATISVVIDFDTVIARFFAASIVLHICGFLWLALPRRSFNSQPEPPVRVSLLPEQPLPEQPPKGLESSQPQRSPKSSESPQPQRKRPRAAREPAPTRAAKAPAIIAKRSSPPLPDQNRGEKLNPSPSKPRDIAPNDIGGQPPAPHEPLHERTVIVERPLPTMKDLLPSATYSMHEDGGPEQGSVSLYTTDPKYMTYVGKIRQSIESEWQYPEIALRYGLQGKLALEFTILGDGHLEGLRLLRSSGSSLLDDEALRAIKAAAPFPPIPPWIRPNPLRITATMEYRDSRLDYRFTR